MRVGSVKVRNEGGGGGKRWGKGEGEGEGEDDSDDYSDYASSIGGFIDRDLHLEPNDIENGYEKDDEEKEKATNRLESSHTAHRSKYTHQNDDQQAKGKTPRCKKLAFEKLNIRANRIER